MQVYGLASESTATNLALSGTASQSSTYGDYTVATRAIDNNTSGLWSDNSIAHTSSSSEANAWWKVELAQVSDINQIVVWNRTACCSTRMNNFTVEVLDAGGAVLWTKLYPSAPNPSTTINLNATGKTVRISKSGFISLAEVQVYGVMSSNALGNSSFQSNNRLLVEEMNTQKQQVLQIYPNPTTVMLHITGVATATNIEIYDMKGKLVATYKNASDGLELSHLQKGMYILVVYQNEEQQIRKFIKH